MHAWSDDDYYYDDDAPHFGDTFHSRAAANQRQYRRSSCNCVKLADCSTVTLRMRTAPKPLTTDFMTDIRKKLCGFVGNDPYICCPPPPTAFDIFSRSFREMTSERPWIWDIVHDRHETPKATDEQSTNLFNRISGSSNTNAWHNFNFLRPNDFNAIAHKPYLNKNVHSRKIHFFDFEDPHTFRNCPPSFSPDFNLPPHFQHVKPIKKSPHTTMPPMVTTPSNSHAHPHPHPQSQPHSPFDSNNVDTDPTIVFPSRSNAAVDSVTTFPSRASRFPPEKLNLINQENCGISIGARIIGGTNSIPGQFPW